MHRSPSQIATPKARGSSPIVFAFRSSPAGVVHDWTAAEDIAQETLKRGLEALRAGRIRNPDALGGYLFQTALRLCMHRGRSAGAREEGAAAPRSRRSRRPRTERSAT
jgi:DNA-directed RNA polymerase specialized sigma24 family protein